MQIETELTSRTSPHTSTSDRKHKCAPPNAHSQKETGSVGQLDATSTCSTGMVLSRPASCPGENPGQRNNRVPSRTPKPPPQRQEAARCSLLVTLGQLLLAVVGVKTVDLCLVLVVVPAPEKGEESATHRALDNHLQGFVLPNASNRA
uniref:Uncharacterized protein n=1 Tax=Haptolina ericina TaxID=156174 RepID=A0A7S3AMH5_9EUKA